MNTSSLRWILGGGAALLSFHAIGAGYQSVTPTATALSVSPGAEVVVDGAYTTSDANPGLTGLGLRIHFNNQALRWVGFDRLVQNSLVAADAQPMADDADYDGDPSTDAYVTVAWAAPMGGWPGALPTGLLEARFEVIGDGTTAVRFSPSATASGYGFRSGAVEITIRR